MDKVFRQGFRTVALGLTIGFCAALALMQVLKSFLVGLEPDHRSNIWIAVGSVTLTDGIACWIPACCAARTESITASRQE